MLPRESDMRLKSPDNWAEASKALHCISTINLFHDIPLEYFFGNFIINWRFNDGFGYVWSHKGVQVLINNGSLHAEFHHGMSTP